MKNMALTPQWSERQTVELTISNTVPPGSQVRTDLEYTYSEIYLTVSQHFIDVHPSKNKKVLLLLDRYCTHCKNLGALLLPRENGVVLMKFAWSHDPSPRTSLYQNHVAEIFKEAYKRAATIETTTNGFRVYGV